MPADVCPACGEALIDTPTLERAELAVANALAQAGVADGPAFRYMRKALGFRAKELAEHLNVSAESISRWENGERPVQPHVFALLALMVAERVAGGRTLVEQLLAAIRQPRELGDEIISLVA
jgi:DNA-binding transcriptional regulator YiaG